MRIIKQQLPALPSAVDLFHMTTVPSHSMLPRKPGMTARMRMKTSSAAASFTVCAALDPFGNSRPSLLFLFHAVHRKAYTKHSHCSNYGSHAVSLAARTGNDTHTLRQHSWAAALLGSHWLFVLYKPKLHRHSLARRSRL